MCSKEAFPLDTKLTSTLSRVSYPTWWLGFYMVCFALLIKQNHSRNMRAAEITFQVSRRMRKNVSLFIKINKFPTYLNARIKHEIGRNGSWLLLKYVDSGFHTMDSCFHALDFGFQNLKFCWIPNYFASGDLQLCTCEKELLIAWHFVLLEYIELNNYELACWWRGHENRLF